MLHAVQRYQIERMRVTHEALLRTPGYGQLCEFFLRDLYGLPEVGASRAAALSTLVDVLRSVLPRWIREGAAELVELYALSEQLDDRLARMLLHRGASTRFSAAEFESAYFHCDDYADRIRQIELSAASTSFGHTLSTHRSVARLLAVARALPGFPRLNPLLALLERGYRAMNQVRQIGPFIEAMRSGETTYVNGVYARQRD
jgi:hypothetical protein